jgi:methyl coenzyme M reductase subunit C
MLNDSSIGTSRDLAIIVRTPDGETVVKLSRLNAQVFAATLRAYSGLPSKGVEQNAGTFNTVCAEAVRAEAKTLPVVRLGKRRGSVRL